MPVIPIMVDLQEKRVIVVGGGKVAKRKINVLLEAEALLTLISPEIHQDLYKLYTQGLIKWEKKTVRKEDLLDAFLIIIATNNPEVNKAVSESAPKNCLINSSADAENGNVHFPSHFKRGKLNIAVSTSGASPMLAKKIKKDLSMQFNESYEGYLDFLFEARTLIKGSSLSRQEKNKLLAELIEETYYNPIIQKSKLTELRSSLKT